MGNQYEDKGGRQLGGGPGTSDNAAPGGSSGTGGYGNIQDRMQGQEEQGADAAAETRPDPLQSRGEAFDEAQGGGRDDQSLSGSAWDDPQGEGGGLPSQMEQDDHRPDFNSEESEADAPS